jgi:large subunit ribosomal protein L22
VRHDGETQVQADGGGQRATAEEEAKIAKLRVMNYKKLARKEKQLMPHWLIEVSPKWARKVKEEAVDSA